MTKVRFYSMFRELIRKDSVEVKGNVKIKELLERIIKKTGADESIFFKSEKVKRNFIILQNGKSVTFEKNVFVKDDDEISIIPILIGG